MFAIDKELASLLFLAGVCLVAMVLFGLCAAKAYKARKYGEVIEGSILTVACFLMFWLFFSPIVGITYNL